MTTQACRVCGEEKSANEFSAGHRKCKACRSRSQVARNMAANVGKPGKCCTKCRQFQCFSAFRPTKVGGLTSLCGRCLDGESDIRAERAVAFRPNRLNLALRNTRLPVFNAGPLRWAA